MQRKKESASKGGSEFPGDELLTLLRTLPSNGLEEECIVCTWMFFFYDPNVGRPSLCCVCVCVDRIGRMVKRTLV